MGDLAHLTRDAFGLEFSGYSDDSIFHIRSVRRKKVKEYM